MIDEAAYDGGGCWVRDVSLVDQYQNPRQNFSIHKSCYVNRGLEKELKPSLSLHM